MSKHIKIRWLLITLGILLLLELAPRWLHAAGPAADELQAVWQRVRQAGAYAFNADLTQILTPLPTVKNAGRKSKETRIYLEGETDLAAESLRMTMWSSGGSVSSPETGTQVKVADGQAFARQGGQPWKLIDDFSGMFAPSGDFMAYLMAADNVVRGDLERQNTPSGEIAFVRYTFDINGHRFAEYMRDQMTQQLSAKGELPPGLSLELPKAYAGMTAQGELWVGEDGLPIRQIFDMQFPEVANDHTVSAQVSVDFSGFSPLPTPPLSTQINQALRRVIAGVTTPAGALPLLALVLGMGLIAVVIRHRHSKTLYTAVVLAIISSMLLTPLMRSAQVQAFADRQHQQRLQQEEQQAQQDAQDQLQAQMLAPDFDPHADPMAKTQVESTLLATTAITTTTVTSSLYDDSSCSSDPNGDDDGDKLTNLEECLLGTNPNAKDSDFDNVDDYTEVTGVTLQDSSGHLVNWYTDPLKQDSNNDGISDGKEWLLDANGDHLPDDTDGDGTPDMWDRDNDGDGVPDNLDLSPFFSTKGSLTFSAANPFQLLIDDLTPNDLVRVDFQLSPTDANHLWYTLNVLDWPKGDQQGQIQDADGKTFFDLNSNIAMSPNNEGDVRLIPMLEIEISGSPDNLPSEDLLNKFGISVKQTSRGTQAAYVPLQLVTDPTGEKNVAFSGGMYYRAASSWGNAQQVRLVWLVQALVDRCDAFKDNVCTHYSQYNDLQIVQTYDDDWFLTGLSVNEERGAQIATIYEDPAVANDAPLYLNTLFLLLYSLDQTFLAGADCDTTDSNGNCVGDGNLDVTVDEIARRFDHATNSNVSDEDRFGIENVLSVETGTYDSLDLGMLTTTVTTTKGVLDNHFTPAWSASAPISPTVMYAWHERATGRSTWTRPSPAATT